MVRQFGTISSTMSAASRNGRKSWPSEALITVFPCAAVQPGDRFRDLAPFIESSPALSANRVAVARGPVALDCAVALFTAQAAARKAATSSL